MNPSKVQIPQLFLIVLKFIGPFLIWMFMFRDFILGHIALNMDSVTIYSVTKFYFNNLLNGVVPLWDPFVLLGTPFYAITLCNLFNPVTVLVPLLKILGMNYYDAFIVYIVSYFFIGVMGFYCLAKELFKDDKAAYVSFLMLLYSGIGASLFNQLTIVELFVPAVWFFVYFLRFIKSFKKSDFLGLSYSTMIVMISYVPFYFATMLMCAIVLATVMYFKECRRVFIQSCIFTRRNIGIVILGVLGVLVSCAPLVVYKIVDSSGDVVSPARHCNFASPQECYDQTLNEQGGMSYKETSQSGNLAERIDGRSLFTHLDKLSYGVDQFFYVPALCYLLIVLAAFLPLDRKLLFLGLLAMLLTLIGLADAAPLHKFLYDRVFFFKYFRNLFFFQSYIIPLAILFCVGQLQRLWSYQPIENTARKIIIVWVLAVHVAVCIFLGQHDGVIISSWFCVALSLLIWLSHFLWISKKMFLVLNAGLIVVLVLQPMEVFENYRKNAREFHCELPKEHLKPQFSWVRPIDEIKSECKIFKFVHYESFYNSMAMKDARGYVGYPVNVTRGVFLLSQWIEQKTLADFSRYKFFLYDNVRIMDESESNIRRLGDLFKEAKNTAYVIKSGVQTNALFNQEDWGGKPLIALQGSSPLADIQRFDVNHLTISLNLPEKKFLVYTDGVTHFWQVFINGRPEELLRANVGFKGVWVPEGKSVVEFRYQPPGGGFVYLFVSGVLIVFLGILFILSMKEKNWPWTTQKQGAFWA